MKFLKYLIILVCGLAAIVFAQAANSMTVPAAAQSQVRAIANVR